MSNSANAALASPWKDLWNGDLSLTDKIIAEDFRPERRLGARHK